MPSFVQESDCSSCNMDRVGFNFLDSLGQIPEA